MRNKIVAAEKYPERKIPFTEMSRNVFKKNMENITFKFIKEEQFWVCFLTLK